MKRTERLALKSFDLYENDELIMRLGLGLTLFIPKPFRAIKKNLWAFWQHYLDMVGKDTFTWARLGGGNRSRAVRDATFRTIEAWLTGSKDYGSDCWISIHDGPIDAIGQNSFRLEGLDQAGEDVGFVEVEFPVDLIDLIEPTEIADKLIGLAAKVPFLSGVAGFFFHRSPYMLDETVGKMADLSARFEGVEITANERMCYWAGKGLTTINWITFVGDIFAEKLGGSRQLAGEFPRGCSVTPLQYGIAIRAGDAPRLGDKNAGGDELELWRKVYKILKPLQFVNSAYEFDPDYFDGVRTAQWLQRLDS